MKVPLQKNKDFLAGLMFIIVGCGAMYMARDYPFGSALRMGPGYFPTVLGGLVAIGGVATMISGLKSQEPVTRPWSLRALILLPASAWTFGFLMEKAGFVPAIFALSIIAALSSPEFRWKEQVILALGLTAGCVLLFVYGIGLPYPLFSGH